MLSGSHTGTGAAVEIKFGVELSYVIILGIVIGIPAMILAGPVFAGFIGKKIHCTVPSSYLENEKEAEQKNTGKKPNFWLIHMYYSLFAVFDHPEYIASFCYPLFMKRAQPVLAISGNYRTFINLVNDWGHAVFGTAPRL